MRLDAFVNKHFKILNIVNKKKGILTFMTERRGSQNFVEVWYLNTNFNTLWEYLIHRIKYLESCILGSSLNLLAIFW